MILIRFASFKNLRKYEETPESIAKVTKSRSQNYLSKKLKAMIELAR
ncbi:hypothetical protein LEP1GSC055_3902 [Leptospira borgpetersenii str. Brem 307]|uniref:Uncharacterized protein n=1 Tax=Leptospira borgpetersenii str. Brem 328 TaxID=1049780 RepID=A0ABC9SIT7_LEPBO|nr:hypothetical protein LEP1GSC055_3902 [Leptospira borgpetersenii str. Brem 307]EMN17627.1 hypothetical protein LEP1GSC056_2970 [Leptospira borgpetersenii str. Brem 328]